MAAPCERIRDALSAQLDGEDPGMDAGIVDDHVAGCAACRAWLVAGAAVTRSVRVHEAEPVPDLSGPIMARIAAAREATPPSSTPSLVRLALALVAVAQATL